ncbi:MAG: iron ABC transporter permease, partial [Clostridia bacterium]|nr:iron ABC transporter permease [Clostridia bacterium]
SIGINVPRSRFAVSAVAVLLSAASTAIVGAVSFLGLIVPHIARLIVSNDHKKLVPFSAVLGAFVFLAADTFGRWIAYPYEISASILMAVVGGPVFLILLLRSKKYV